MELVEIFNIICQNIEPIWNSQLCHIIVLTLAIFISFLCVGKGVLYYLLKLKNKTEHHWRQKILPITELSTGLFLGVFVVYKAIELQVLSAIFLVSLFLVSALLAYLGNKYKSLLAFKNKDTVNHTLQVLTMLSFLLFFIALWVIGLKTSTDNKELIPVGLITVILPLIFRDSIAGAIAYFHIHTAGLLHIGDWIQVPSYHIDGMVKDINLVSVIIENWDNTLSNVPISALQNGGFKNYQQMLNGETSGRRMLRSFIIDTNSVVEYGKNEVDNLINIVKEKDNLSEQNEQYNSSRRIKNVFTGTPILNLRLFREYLDFWLASNTNISPEPRLLVRVMEQTIEGIPLQVYVFITKNSLVEFEKVQSKITEHIITSMGWFGLKLYQRPASADLKNDNHKN